MPTGLYIDAGWDAAAFPVAFEITDSGTNVYNVVISSGLYSHTGFEAGGQTYEAFGPALETAIANAGWPHGGTVSVTFDEETERYTWTMDGDTWSLSNVAATYPLANSDDRGAALLGMNSDGTTLANTLVGEFKPWHYVSPKLSGRSGFLPHYEPEDVVRGAIAQDGSMYCVARVAGPRFSDFTIEKENISSIYSCHRVEACPFTYEDLWDQVRCKAPFLVDDGCHRTVHWMRPEGGSFRPEREFAETDAYFRTEFRTIIESCEAVVEEGAPPPSSLSLPTTGLILELDARASLTTENRAGHDYVTDWNGWAQAAEIRQPSYSATLGPNGGPVVGMTSSNVPGQTLDAKALDAPGALLASSGPITIYAGINPTVTSSSIQAIFDFQTGRRINTLRDTTNTGPGWFDGAFKSGGGTLTTGWQVFTWVLQNSGAETFIDRVSQGTGTYSEAAWGGTGRLASYYNSFGNGFRGDAVFFFAYSAAHNATQRAAVWDYINQEWTLVP